MNAARRSPGKLITVVEGKEPAAGHDASIEGLIEAIGRFRRY